MNEYIYRCRVQWFFSLHFPAFLEAGVRAHGQLLYGTHEKKKYYS